MPRQHINRAELGLNASLDPKPEYIPDSLISRSPEQALQAEIELLADGFAKKDKKMQQMILHDLHLAQNGTGEQVATAKQKLSKIGISTGWPAEVLSVVESRFKETGLQVQDPDYRKDPKYKDFHNLFKNDADLN